MIAIITTCMNRNKLLYNSLETWKELNIPIIIIDWSSTIPVSASGNNITVIRVDGEQYFHLTKAKNLSLSAAKNINADYVLSLDCDVKIVNKNNLSKMTLSPEIFYRGFAAHTNGSFFCSLEEILQVGGYDESIQGYNGNDCSKLYYNLRKKGLKMEVMPPNFIIHQDHEGRLDNYPK